MKPIAAVLLVVALLVAACDDDKVKYEQFFYPMEPGTVWYYTSTLVSDYDTAQVIDGSGTITVDVVDSDSSGGVGQPLRFDVASQFVQTGSPGAWFYRQTPAGLYVVASCGNATVMVPKRSAAGSSAFAGIPVWLLPDMSAGAGCGDAPIEHWDDPAPTLLYPWRVGTTWIYRGPPATPMTIQKRVTRYANVTVPAGKFKAYHVVWSYEGFPDIHVDDDIADIGLIRRVITLEHQTPTTYEFPFNEQEYTAIEETELDSVRIPPDTTAHAH